MSGTDDLLREALNALNHNSDGDLINRIERQLDTTESIVWSIDDIKGLDEGAKLTDEQAKQVLSRTLKFHDCSNGITWDSFIYTIDELYPKPL